MNRLLAIGFEPAGHWYYSGDELACELTRHSSQRNILYAFICDGEVKYVGKTVQTLQQRMAGYKKPASSQTTNLRNNSRIKALLTAGAAVDILALPDNGLLHYGHFHINLAAGLEDNIIRLLAPEWNGSVASKEEMILESEPALWKQTEPGKSFALTLHKTYFARGFFNVGVDHADLFGADGQEIEIFCGKSDQPLIGVINRTANSNLTPRIMGGVELRTWFQRELHEMQEASIQVLSPTSIRIEAR